MRLGPPEGSFFDIFLKIAKKKSEKTFLTFFSINIFLSHVFIRFTPLYISLLQ